MANDLSDLGVEPLFTVGSPTPSLKECTITWVESTTKSDTMVDLPPQGTKCEASIELERLLEERRSLAKEPGSNYGERRRTLSKRIYKLTRQLRQTRCNPTRGYEQHTRSSGSDVTRLPGANCAWCSYLKRGVTDCPCEKPHCLSVHGLKECGRRCHHCHTLVCDLCPCSCGYIQRGCQEPTEAFRVRRWIENSNQSINCFTHPRSICPLCWDNGYERTATHVCQETGCGFFGCRLHAPSQLHHCAPSTSLGNRPSKRYCSDCGEEMRHMYDGPVYCRDCMWRHNQWEPE